MLVRDHFWKMVRICIWDKVWFPFFAVELPSVSNFPGHLMGKKSIERLPDPLETSSDHFTPPDVAGATEPDRYQGLLEALVLQQNHGNMVRRAADWLRGQRSGWREEERDKYLREVSLWLQHPLTGSLVKIEGWIFYFFSTCVSALQMSHLLLWALKVQDRDSTWVQDGPSQICWSYSHTSSLCFLYICQRNTLMHPLIWVFLFKKILISKLLLANDSPSGFQTVACN